MSACAGHTRAHTHAPAPSPRRSARRFGRRTRTGLVAAATLGIVLGGGVPLAASASAPAVGQVQSTGTVVGQVRGAATTRANQLPETQLDAARQLVTEIEGVAEFGYFGDIAQEINPRFLADNPVRLPFTAGEQTAATWIAAELNAVGFEGDAVTVQEFGLDVLTEPQMVTLDRLGSTSAPAALNVSQNVFVRIAGSDAEAGVIVLGAGYDSFMPAELEPDAAFGSNVALLLEAAQRLADADLAQTVYVAFFGADAAGRVGARYFFGALPSQEQHNIALVLNVDAIGAADTLFFTADVCDGGERCPEQSARFAAAVNEIASADLVLFKEENFDFSDLTCPCCVFGVPESVVGVPVVTLFAFDFDLDFAEVDAATSGNKTNRALAEYQQFIQTLLRSNTFAR